MNKTILEIFNRYTPSDEDRRLLEGGRDPVTRVDKANRLVEVEARFDKIIPKKTLERIEKEICRAYGIAGVHFVTKYDPALFDEKYVSELFEEARRRGAISQGFFNEYDCKLTSDRLEVSISFTNGGIELLYSANTPKTIEKIIKDEFGLDYKVEITRDEDGGLAFAEMIRQTEQKYADDIGEWLAKGGFDEPEDKPEEEDPDKPALKRVSTISDKDAEYSNVDGVWSVGRMRFDVSSPEFIYGDPFDLEPMRLRDLDRPVRNAVVFGEVTAKEVKTTKSGDKIIFEIAITDRDSSIYCKLVTDSDDGEVTTKVSEGDVIAVLGNVRHDKFAKEYVLNINSIARISKRIREDKAEKKRVELHLHTCMSSMDAVSAPEDVIKLAKKWGHPAVAITDHGTVQAFPRAMYQSEKSDMKVIYGMEAYYVDDTQRAIYGDKKGVFATDEFCVFDIETTGLSRADNRITEIGAVIVKGDEVVDIFSTYVDPETPIPKNIVELTGITDEMVKGAPKEKEAVESFLAFAGDRILIAHNATFDVGFISRVCSENKIPFTPTYIDTVPLSRHVNPDLNKHRLDTIAKYYDLGDFGHHRAYNDAEMLSKIFFKMIERLKKDGVTNTDEMIRDMGEKADPLKIRPHHMTLLVKNKAGLKNLYKIVSAGYLEYYYRYPRLPKTRLDELREGLLVGSACEAGELFQAVITGKSDAELCDIAKYYDYLEIQPLSNNRFMIDGENVENEEKLRDFNRKVVEIGEKTGIPVVATCDSHFIEKDDEVFRNMLQFDRGYSDFDSISELYFRTTDEMLEEFSYLGEEKAYEVVVTNTNLINDMIEKVRPIPEGFYPPSLPGCNEELQELCWNKAKELYGDPLPELVYNRLERELEPIVKNGFAVMYMIAQKLIARSEEQGYLVGSRGSVGSSFAATMCGVTEVNPLPPHYRCPKCKRSEFFTKGEYGSGFDMPDKKCPECGVDMVHDGHDIPFETFLGFNADKTPDIDLNFSGDVQGDVHKYTEVLFGAENVFRAGTLGTLADKKVFALVSKYLENKGVSVNRAEMQRLINGCLGVKQTTGQHPGGIIVIPREYDVYDFTPVQHPADDRTSDIVTTHFEFSHLHDTILKLDLLGHDVPTKYKMLENYSGTSVLDVPMNDRKVMSLFTSTEALGVTPEDIDSEVGTFGLPEFGTGFTRQMLMDAKPKVFSDLLQISGLSHGTGVWLGNAKDLIKNGICTISNCVGTRDSIMVYLQHAGVPNGDAFKIMENVRKKNKNLTPEQEVIMREHNVPEWYIDSCKKIEYMFPKAHAAAYVMSAIRLGWYKVYKPVVFYAAYFSAAPDGFDGQVVMNGHGAVKAKMREIEEKGRDASATEKETFSAMQLVNEAMCRGIGFLPVDLFKSDARAFLPEDGKIRIPFSCLPGLGLSVAQNIVKAREENVISVEELAERGKLSKKVIDLLRDAGAFKDLPETNQISFF